jgi:two-component system cell cycle sensor histidine kinase/response regulator CckA
VHLQTEANRAGFDAMKDNKDVTAHSGITQTDRMSLWRRLAIGLALMGLPALSAAIALLVTGGTSQSTGMAMLLMAVALLVAAAATVVFEIHILPKIGINAYRRSVRSVSELEHDVCVLTDSTGKVIYANPAALRFWAATAPVPEGPDTPVEQDDGFGLVQPPQIVPPMPETLALAWPAFSSVFERLAKIAGAGSPSSDDFRINGRNSHLAVHRTAGGDLLWRLTEVSRGGIDPSRLPLPLLTLGRTDTILFMNEAAAELIGMRPRNVEDIFGEVPIAAGQIRQIQSKTGLINVALSEMDSYRGRRDLMLLPIAPSELNVEPAPAHIPAQTYAQTVPAGLTAANPDAAWDRFDNLPVPLLRLDLAGRVEMANAPALALLGEACQPGKHLGGLTEGLGRPISDWLAEVAAGRQAHASEFLRVQAPQPETYVQISLNLIEEDGNRGLLAVLTDATELKTLEAQFVQSQKMQAIGQLAGGVAHDFNNLLTAITGHCDLLLLRHDQGDQDYADLMQINQNANRAASLVSQLLAFSRKQTLRPEEVDLRDTLSDLTHLLNRLVGEKVSLQLSHDSQLSTIRADKRQLEQVMMNLVVNARDAMPAGGEIQIITERLHLTEPLQRDRATVPMGEYASVKVIDTGCGIAPEQLAKVFEPFFTTKRVGEGTGLGLSTAYGIVKQTGGFIFADSKVDEGTTFTLLFPAYQNTAEVKPAAPEPIRASARHSDGVVLLVEDEAPVRAFASRALRLRGYTVHEAASAEEALEILEDQELEVDIFVTDVVMPGMDGPTWVRQALKERPDVRVVFVSGYAEESFGDEQAKITNSVFLPKPFSLSELTETVQSQMH